MTNHVWRPGGGPGNARTRRGRLRRRVADLQLAIVALQFRSALRPPHPGRTPLLALCRHSTSRGRRLDRRGGSRAVYEVGTKGRAARAEPVTRGRRTDGRGIWRRQTAVRPARRAPDGLRTARHLGRHRPWPDRHLGDTSATVPHGMQLTVAFDSSSRQDVRG
jgi:hypothetical protein